MVKWGQLSRAPIDTENINTSAILTRCVTTAPEHYRILRCHSPVAFLSSSTPGSRMAATTTPPDELQLVQLCAHRASAGWAQLHELHSSAVQTTIRHTLIRFGATNNLDEDCLDIYGTFLLALMKDNARRLRAFAGRSSLRTFLRVAASNFCIDQLRRRRATLSLDYTDQDGTPTIVIADTTPAADHSLVQQQLRHDITRWWDALDEDERALAHALFVDQLPGDVIADHLGISIANVYTRSHRLRKKLQTMAVKDGWHPDSLLDDQYRAS